MGVGELQPPAVEYLAGVVGRIAQMEGYYRGRGLLAFAAEPKQHICENHRRFGSRP